MSTQPIRGRMTSPVMIRSYGISSDVDVSDVFARIPDRIVLSVSTRDLDLNLPNQCLCGWAVREAIAEAEGLDAGEVDAKLTLFGVPARCCERFGGQEYEWNAVYWGTADTRREAIEGAWVDRVLEAVKRA